MRDAVNAQPLWFEEMYREERKRRARVSPLAVSMSQEFAAMTEVVHACHRAARVFAPILGVDVPAAPAPPLKAQSSDGNHEAHPEAGCCIQTDCIQCVSRVLPEG